MTNTHPKLSAAAADRAAGVLLGLACGDALGAPYEFGPAMAGDAAVGMIGGGPFGWEPGEWTDDTSMAIPILEAAERALSDGNDLLDHLDDVVGAWYRWSLDAKDVGSQTRAVLGSAARPGPITSVSTEAAAWDRFAATGRAGGNGSLMRTAPVALAYLDDPDQLVVAARKISDLTHPDPNAGDACVLWCLAIRHAVLTGGLDICTGLERLPDDRQGHWADLIHEAEHGVPTDFPHNGWVVHAFQAAWSSISRTPVPLEDPAADSYPAQHLKLALETAVRAGGDTDTVAAIAGSLLGARWGSSAVPAQWRRIVHGWPGVTGGDLADRGLVVARGGPDANGWPLADWIDNSAYGAIGQCVPHPHDPGVLLGDAGVLDDLPAEVDADRVSVPGRPSHAVARPAA